MSLRSVCLGTTILSALASVVVSTAPGIALAQDAGQDANAKPAEAAPQAAVEPIEELVVTGSRIRRSEFASTSPIQVIETENSTLAGITNTSQMVQGSTVAGNATQINNFFTGFVVNGGPGVKTVSLRGLGTQRTLVLLNGKRLGPAGTRGQVGAVDLNTLPYAMLQRTEILKDGASAVYGSDAVGGVVNFITKKNIDGAEARVQFFSPFEGGNEQMSADYIYGKVLSKGYFNVGLALEKEQALRFNERDFLSCPQDYVFDPSTGLRLDLIDPATGKFKCQNTLSGRVDNLSNGRSYVYDAAAIAGGGVSSTDLAGLKRVGGVFANPDVTRASAALQPTNDPKLGQRMAISPTTSYTVFGSGAYDITPSIQAYGDILLGRRESSQESFGQLFPTVNPNNPNNPFRIGNPNGYAPGFARSVILRPSNGEQTVEYYRAVAGFKGELPDIGFLKGWDWDVYAQYSKSHGEYGGTFVYNDRVLATTGASACNVALLTTATSCPTGGVNYFRPSTVNTGVFTPEEAAFIYGYETGSTDYTQQYVEGSISGSLFSLPAGDVKSAIGVHLRKEEIDDQPGAQASASNLWGQTTAGRTAGSDTVKELFGEVEVPILKGATLAESLSLNLSGRFSDYDSYGTNSTYKAGVNWQVIPSIRLRYSQGTSFRAPALYELYLGNQTGFLGQTSIDPCINYGESDNPILSANCASQGIPADYNAAGTSSALITTGGGAGLLDPETAKSKTVGIVWSPSFSTLRVALDYFDIKVEDQVARFGSDNILGSCYAAADFPNNPLCSLFTRDLNPTSTSRFAITAVNDSYINIAQQDQRGLDLTVNYERRFDAFKLGIESRATWIFDWNFKLFGQDSQRYIGYLGSPDFNGYTDLRVDKGDWTYFWNMRYVSKTSDSDYYGRDVYSSYRSTGKPYYAKQQSEMQVVHSLSVRRKYDKWSWLVGVRNIFDEQPPILSSGTTRVGNVALNTSYDWTGRAVNVVFTRSW
jgi:iron complex outermembrane receptor protein